MLSELCDAYLLVRLWSIRKGKLPLTDELRLLLELVASVCDLVDRVL